MVKVRNSNLELYRIIVMLLIVAHHYVVNSGLMEVLSQDPLSGKSIFLYWFGMWGKIGINCFVLITGYFMCCSSITLRKFLKLLLEIYFYRIVIHVVFVATGVSDFSFKECCLLLLPFRSVADNFTGCFLLFYLCIPFLTILIQHLTRKQHLMLLILCLFIYTLWGSMPKMEVRMNYVTWFGILFFIASYIRLYGLFPSISHRTWGFLTIFMALLSMLSVIVMLVAGKYLPIPMAPYYWVADSNKILAVATSVCSFMYFKDLRIKHHPLINTIAACTFGIFLIHANSDAMRQWLWRDVLDNVGWYASDYIVLHALLSVIIVFVLCGIIDYCRGRWLEKWIFLYIDKWLQKRHLN